MGWVQGGGNAVGMLAELLAAGLNANLGGRDHIPIDVERQIVEWTRDMFGFPPGAGGIFVTGTSMANLLAVLVARTSALGQAVRQRSVSKIRPDCLHVARGPLAASRGRWISRALAAIAMRQIEVDRFIASMWKPYGRGSPPTGRLVQTVPGGRLLAGTVGYRGH